MQYLFNLDQILFISSGSSAVQPPKASLASQRKRQGQGLLTTRSQHETMPSVRVPPALRLRAGLLPVPQPAEYDENFYRPITLTKFWQILSSGLPSEMLGLYRLTPEYSSRRTT
jgi:hypothetical protein